MEKKKHMYLLPCLCVFLSFVPSTEQNVTSQTSARWIQFGFNKQCNTDLGEVLLRNLSGSLTHCQTSCEVAPKCNSITYFEFSKCSHFSTSCSHVKDFANAKIFRLIRAMNTTLTTDATKNGEFIYTTFLRCYRFRQFYFTQIVQRA